MGVNRWVRPIAGVSGGLRPATAGLALGWRVAMAIPGGAWRAGPSCSFSVVSGLLLDSLGGSQEGSTCELYGAAIRNRTLLDAVLRDAFCYLIVQMV